MRIYVSCELAHATDQFLFDFEFLKGNIRRLGHEVPSCLVPTDSTPRYVYDHVIGTCIEKCDIFIVILGESSERLAYELAIAIEVHKKRTLIFRHKDRLTTRLILGIPENKAYQATYKGWDDLFGQIETMLGSLNYPTVEDTLLHKFTD